MDAALAASEPFSFVVGEERREFTIHSVIVANQSECLKKLVNGHFLEGTAKKVLWTHVEELTFICFWRYVYTGNYTVQSGDDPLEGSVWGRMSEAFTDRPGVDSSKALNALASVANAEPTVERESAAPAEDEWTSFAVSKKKKKAVEKPTKQECLWSTFILLRKQGVPNTAEEKGNQRAHLLQHAKVYTFADCYGVTPLMMLSYNKLHQSLIDMKHAWTLTEFVALARYCYESLVPDDLKILIVAFTACMIERLWDTEQFQDLLAAHGELSKNVIGSLRSRLE
ncbi:hypothetical protein PWT90_06638 [Aphanocladium album]|nr:hypothetical protein PWT90_06638 [Aphanocladium album]